MNTFANAIRDEATTTTTENGDKTFSTSLNACLDLFFQIGAIRGQGAARAINLFQTAYKEDPELASRILLWARDVREGAGERQVFKDILSWLEVNDSARLEALLPLVPELGRWDDLFVLTSEKMIEQVLTMFAFDLRSDNQFSLSAKWSPREGSSKDKIWGKRLREFMKLSPKAYRKLIVSKTKVVETQMCAKDWENINYSHVPSVASSRYSKAFKKHDGTRYGEFITKAVKGEAKINASTLFPYDVLKPTVDSRTATALWNQLPDFVPEGVSFIPMIDVSGSMTSQVGTSGVTCMSAAISLGMYLAEHNKSAFKNLALTFSGSPAWIKIPGVDDVQYKYHYIQKQNWAMDTNLDAAMLLVLNTAIANKVPASEMPNFLIVFSDMEFNSGYGSKTVAQRTEEMFKLAGYKMPSIVWWNIQSRNGNTPVRYDEKGMALVSGLSPSVTKSVLVGDVDPLKAMINTVAIPRYDH